MQPRGIVAAGHSSTADAAAEILSEGGNAYDAVLAALATACSAEPLLASLGGGGFLLARPESGKAVVFDFFAQTPGQRNRGNADFYPILGDFGGVTQEFHIGLGSMAVPGVVRGIFEVHRELGSLPLSRILEPAIRIGRSGAVHNDCQAYIERILAPILQSTPEMERLFPQGRERFKNPEFSDFLDELVSQGEDFFYLGEPAQTVVSDCKKGGGHLSLADFRDYQVVKRPPLEHRHRGARFYFNPPPSSGGALISHSLKLLESTNQEVSPNALARAQHLSNCARRQAIQGNQVLADFLSSTPPLQEAFEAMRSHPASTRGTTQISVADGRGQLASLTVSNGEGSGYVIPSTGILFNNFLGEEDLNPKGLGTWPLGQRMSSMMCPTLAVLEDGSSVALGSGGSNRLRTAILQVLIGLVDRGMSLEEAVTAPRVHHEKGHVDVEPGFPEEAVESLRNEFRDLRLWSDRNLFFGGVHAVQCNAPRDLYQGIGDPRRDGVYIRVNSSGPSGHAAR